MLGFKLNNISKGAPPVRYAYNKSKLMRLLSITLIVFYLLSLLSFTVWPWWVPLNTTYHIGCYHVVNSITLNICYMQYVCIFTGPGMKTIDMTLMAATIVTYVMQAIDARCHSFDFYLPAKGRYCSTGGSALSDMPRHQCISICLHFKRCVAFNYDMTVDKCTFFHTPCPLAHENSAMEYHIFTEKPAHQYSQWVPYTAGDDLNERIIESDGAERVVGRLKYDGNDIPGYLYEPSGRCQLGLGATRIDSSSSVPCELLYIADDCTAFWVPYTIGQPIPKKAVVGCQMTSGETLYVVKFDYISIRTISGYCTEGALHAVSVYGAEVRSSDVMVMLLILLICCLRMTFPVLNDLLYETLYVVRFDYSSAATRFGYYVEWALHAVSVMGTQDKLPWTMLRWLIGHLKTCFISWSSPHKLILYAIVQKYRSCQ